MQMTTRIGAFLTSYSAVLIGLIIFTWYKCLEFYTLFNRFLPIEEGLKVPATVLVSIILSTSLLIFGCHKQRFKLTKYGNGSWILRFLFITNLALGFFFWNGYSDDGANSQLASFLVLSFKNLTVILFSITEFCYCHLFYSMWTEKAEVANAELSNSLLNEQLCKLQSEVSKETAKLNQLRAQSDKTICPNCYEVFPSISHRNGHMRICKSTNKN